MKLAEKLYGDLKNNGLEVWLDKRDLPGGATWTTEIEEEIDRCKVLLRS